MDEIITELQQRGLKLTVEGTISDFLGVEIRRSPNGEFHLTQPHLIEQILQDCTSTEQMSHRRTHRLH